MNTVINYIRHFAMWYYGQVSKMYDDRAYQYRLYMQ